MQGNDIETYATHNKGTSVFYLISRDEPVLNKNETLLPLYVITSLIDPCHIKLYFNSIYYCYSYFINVTIVS